MQQALQTPSPFLSISGKQWKWRHKNHGQGVALAQKLGLPQVLGQLLVGRHFNETMLDEITAFLTPKLEHLPDPSHLLDMDKAVNCLTAAIKENKKIAIFGDYDVDGSCAAALLVRYFRELGTETIIYVPDRLTEGYGPNAGAMETLKNKGAQVVITVDCGCLAFDAMEKAAQLGLEVIITDHHQAMLEKPKCVAMVNPNRVDETSPCTMLSGCGVAFFVLMALNRHLRENNIFTPTMPEPKLLNLLDLVAISSICDMVPLTGANRVLVARGLHVQNKRQNKGLAAMMAGANIEFSTPFDAGFIIGPRINAGGRISECDLGARVLSTANEEEAQHLAARLDLLNEERKRIEAEVQEKALLAAEKVFHEDTPALVVAGRGWHPGVIGIVASRLKEKYYRPTFVISIDENGVCKGSGRSISGIDLGRAVINCKDILTNGGGHAMAAGITLNEDVLQTFTQKLSDQVAQQAQKQEGVFTPSLKIDAALTPAAANLNLLDTISKLEPFGAANPEPRFLFNNVKLAYAKTVGADASHVKLTLQGGDGSRLEGICFRAMQTELGPFLMGNIGQKISVVGSIKRNKWHGVETAQIHVQDAAAQELPL